MELKIIVTLSIPTFPTCFYSLSCDCWHLKKLNAKEFQDLLYSTLKINQTTGTANTFYGIIEKVKLYFIFFRVLSKLQFFLESTCVFYH